MGFKPRPRLPRECLWILETDLNEIHAAEIVGEGELWSNEALCGEELIISTPASSKDAGEECAACLKKARFTCCFRVRYLPEDDVFMEGDQ